MWRKWRASAQSDEENEESAESRLARSRRWRRWALIGLGMVVLLSVAGVVMYHFGGRWLERRTRDSVHGYLEQQDYRRAQLMLEQAVQVNPHNLAARRALAEFYDAAGSPLAVAHWREVVALAANDDEVRLKLAGAALRLEGPAPAREVLAEVSPAGRETLDYHRIAAGVALVEQKPDELQQHLAAMAVLEPENLRTKTSLASLQLRSPDPAIAAAARTELERVAGGENQRIRATLVLIKTLPRLDDNTALRALWLRIRPNVALAPAVSGSVALIEHMKGEPHPSAEDAAALADWMIVHGQPREALVWLATQGAPLLNAHPVLVARASAATQLRDWNLLRQLIAEGAWGRVSRDAIELAFAARLQRERAGVANAKETFGDAIELAAPSLATLQALDRLCGVWGWPESSERVLARIVHDFPREQSAWLELLARAEASQKSDRYWDVVRRRAQALPEDLSAQALRTYAAVITRQTDVQVRQAAVGAFANENARGEELAAGLLLRWREQSPADALAALSPRQIETLSRSQKGALVYGAVLSAAGKDSREILARVRLDALLPEERALLPRSQTTAR